MGLERSGNRSEKWIGEERKEGKLTDRSIDWEGQVDAGKMRMEWDQSLAKAKGEVEEDEHGVNASCAELTHALVVVLSSVDGIGTNGVDGELLEVGNVALAGSRICEAERG